MFSSSSDRNLFKWTVMNLQEKFIGGLGRFVAWELLNVPRIALDAKHFCLVNFTKRLLPSIGGNLKPQERMVLK